MSDIEGPNQLISKIENDNLYQKLLTQLNKDFRYAGLSDEFLFDLNPSELPKEVSIIIQRLINNDFTSYLNVLYRIDISENQIKKLDGSDIEQLSAQVSFLILKRECQKVWIRNTL